MLCNMFQSFFPLCDDDLEENERIVKRKLSEIKHCFDYDNFQPLALDDVYGKTSEQSTVTYQ